MAITHKVFTSRNNNLDQATYVGEAGRLFYAQTTGTGHAPTLRYSDGVTVGGLPLSGGSLTFSGSLPPENPVDGNLWWNTTDGRLYIYYDASWVDASPDITNTATDVTLTLLSVSTSSAVGGGALSYNNQSGVFTYHPADLTSFLTATNLSNYTTTATVQALIANSLTNFVYTGTITYNQISGVPEDIDAYTTTATVQALIANSLTNYATQTYVTTRGYITADLFTTTNISTFINDAHYIQNETGVNSVVGTANQVIVTDLGGRNIRLSTPQNLNTTATVQFGDLTVNNISILGTSTNLISNVVQGYRLYLASSATNLSEINGGGIQLGSTSTGVHSIFWNSNGYWDTDGDGIKTLTLEATTSTLTTLEVLGQARFGYVNQHLTLANAYIQVDSNTNNFSQIAMVNHNTGTNASADIVATNDIGNDSTGFIDMGINSSVFSTSSWIINGANDGYLYVAGGNLAIGTDQVSGEIKTFLGSTDNPTIISVANASTVTYSVDLMPSIDAEYLLGRPGQRWKGIYVGTGSVWINDISLGTDAELTVDNGVLYVNGAYQLQVGQLKFFENTIESTTGATDIQIGLTTSTANIKLNRNVVLAAGKTFGLVDTVLGTTATMAVTNGVLTINGANQLQVGQLKFIDNTIESVTPSVNIQIGYFGDTGNITLNRNLVLGSTGTAITFYNGGLQTVAWNSTATVLYNQITGVPGFATTATVNTLIANSLTNFVYTGTVKLSVTTAASGTSALSFTTSTGVLTFTPPNLSGYLTTVTNVAYANTATNLVGGIGVASIAGSSGTNVSASTGAVTVWFNTATLVAQAVIAQSATTSTSAATAYALANTSTTYVGRSSLADSATTSTSAATAYSTVAAHTAGTGLSGSTFNGSTAVTWTLNTATLMANAVSATTATNAGYAYSFNTGTLVTTAVTANTVAGGYVSSITAGTGTQVSTSTGAVTIWTLPAQAITTTATTTASNLTVDLSGSTFIAWQPSANGSRTITLSGFTPGRKVEMFITPHAITDVFTVSGVTTTQCSNNKNTFTLNGVGASQQNSFVLQIYCTTNAIGGVWIYGNGSV